MNLKFDFNNPTRILFGSGALNELVDAANRLAAFAALFNVGNLFGHREQLFLLRLKPLLLGLNLLKASQNFDGVH